MSDDNIIYIGTEKKPNYIMAISVGLCVGICIAVAFAAISIMLEAEYYIVLFIGAGLVGLPIRNYVPNKSLIGSLIGAVLCPLTYFLYQFFISILGYYIESEASYFWIMLCGSIIYGAYKGYNIEDN